MDIIITASSSLLSPDCLDKTTIGATTALRGSFEEPTKGLSTAPPSPGLSYADGESTMSPSISCAGTTRADEEERGESEGLLGCAAVNDRNDQLCAAAAACFAKLFDGNVGEPRKGNGRHSASSGRAAARGGPHHDQLLFVPLQTLVHGGFCSRDTLAFALVIASRLANTGFAISWANCRRVLLCVIMLAGKIHADEFYTFSTLAACVGMPVTTNTMSSLAQCEWKICVALDFCLQCSLDEYNAVVDKAFPQHTF